MIAISSSYAAGINAFRSARSRVLRTPETTSSPCAFWRKSPDGSGAPVVSSRLNATPDADDSPLFPKTICCTLTAGPLSPGLQVVRRHPAALQPLHGAHTLSDDLPTVSRRSPGVR